MSRHSKAQGKAFCPLCAHSYILFVTDSLCINHLRMFQIPQWMLPSIASTLEYRPFLHSEFPYFVGKALTCMLQKEYSCKSIYVFT